MADVTANLPIGQQVSLPGHFNVPVVLEAARPLGRGFECRVRLPDGTLDEAVHLSVVDLFKFALLLVIAIGSEIGCVVQDEGVGTVRFDEVVAEYLRTFATSRPIGACWFRTCGRLAVFAEVRVEGVVLFDDQHDVLDL